MGRALELATGAAGSGDVPVGAVVVSPAGEVIGEGANLREVEGDPTAHAEVVALRAAARHTGEWRLEDCTLVVTLEPCPMCAAAISFARLRRLHFAARDPKGGGVEHGPRIYAQPTCHHRPEVIAGVGEERSAELLRAFFKARR